MDTLYAILLPIHSILRWLVILAGLFAIIRAITGINFKRPWENADDKAGLWYTIFLDSQVLIGLILYVFLSPLTTRLFTAGAAAMSDPATRYFGAEHVVMMVLGVILAHIGRSRSKKMKDRRAKHRNALIFFSLSLLAVLVGIPWPFLPVGRALLPF